jgi:hypothetical protein
MYLSTYILYVKIAKMPKVLQRNMEMKALSARSWAIEEVI